MELRGLVLSAGLLVVAGDAHAARPLTYDEAIRVALERNPTLVGAQVTLDQAAEDVINARGAFDPVFHFTGGWQRTQSVQAFAGTPVLSRRDGWNVESGFNVTSAAGTTASLAGGIGYGTFASRGLGLGGLFTNSFSAWTPDVHLSLTQNLLKGLLPRDNLSAVRRADERRTLAELQAETVKQQAIADVAAAYWTWVDASRLAEIAHRSITTAEEALRVGTAQVAEGRLAPVERTRLEAALVQATSSAISADHTAEGAADTLLLLMGEHPGQPLDPVSEIGEVPPLQLDDDALVAVALEHSPALQIARDERDHAEQALRDARHQLWPSLAANVDASYAGTIPTKTNIEDINQQSGQQLSSSDFVVPSISIGGTLTVPLGNRVALGAVRRAEAEVYRQQTELDALEATLRSNVLRQIRVLESAAQQVQLGDVNLRLARETLAAEEALASVGRSVTKDVLEARSKVDQAEADATKARSDFRRAEVELRRLQGVLGDSG